MTFHSKLLPDPVMSIGDCLDAIEPVETWQNVYKTIEHALMVLAEKMATLDRYMIYPELNVDNQIGKLFTDIPKDFRTIQQIAIRVKNMPVADDAERLDRNKKVIDTAKYLQQESSHFRYQQQMEYMKQQQMADLI